MAFFNKLLGGLRIGVQKTEDDTAGNKIDAFTSDHVRLVLFRECDFRGRKLLFDSNAIQKVPVEKAEEDKTFVEVYDGYGYIVITKQNNDYHHLSEMIFGSVAMSFRGTYMKIHSLQSPRRLMFTQVFPSPHNRRTKSSSTSSTMSCSSTRGSFEHSIKLDDSGVNSAFSTSDRLSDRSTASDTVLVYRRMQSSPLAVPGISGSLSKNSLVVDSGCAGQSFSSVSTGPLNVSTWESLFSHKELSGLSFTSTGVLKRLLRNTTRSLHSSSVSLPNSSEAFRRDRQKGSKLGLSVIIEIPEEKERFLTQFIMEHIVFLEALIWRARHSLEVAYHRRTAFISLMMDLSHNISVCLVNLLSAPRIVTNVWHSLSFGCDKLGSFSEFPSDMWNNRVNSFRTLYPKSVASSSSSSSGDRLLFSDFLFDSSRKRDFAPFNFNTIFKTDWIVQEQSLSPGEFVAEKFLREFCELLEGFDVKHTNFFISTLLTAVLTHHLGWVATVCSTTASGNDPAFNLNQPYNLLWSQLSDLFGAIGYPIKTAQTVITGHNRNNIISKLLNSLTYFIRYGHVDKQLVSRCSVEDDNKRASVICMRNNCIPKENYKKYEDHVKELLINENPHLIIEEEEMKVQDEEVPSSCKQPSKGLTKTKSSVTLSGLVSQSHNTSVSEHFPLLNGCNSNFTLNLDREKNGSEKPKTLSKSFNVVDLAKLQGNCQSRRGSSECGDLQSNRENVIFVLGDNEKLVGLKKEDNRSATIASGAKRKTSLVKRPSSLSLLKDISKPLLTEPTSDPNCKTCMLHHSSSFDALCAENNQVNVDNCDPPSPVKSRAQSEPPEVRKVSPPKYRYSRVKFNLQQYPQVVKNYMKSKNIELEGLSLGEKVFDKFATVQHNIKLDLSGYESDSEEVEALHTPSNASELEFSPDMGVDPEEGSFKAPMCSAQQLKLVNIPMPKSLLITNTDYSVPYISSVMKGLVDTYVPDLVLQGTTDPKPRWDFKLKSNLAMSTQHSLLDNPVDEALAILANTDTWEVQIISSHTYVIDKGTNGVRVGMSQLVASMLETLLRMWKLRIPPQYCILHIEQRLQELCVRSKALSEMLMACEFCSIELLTSSLRIEVNDVPLLMAVASTHTPEVTRKYGLSFQ